MSGVRCEFIEMDMDMELLSLIELWRRDGWRRIYFTLHHLLPSQLSLLTNGLIEPHPRSSLSEKELTYPRSDHIITPLNAMRVRA